MKRRAAPFFGVMNALAKVGVELGENGSILPRPKGGSPVPQSQSRFLRRDIPPVDAFSLITNANEPCP